MSSSDHNDESGDELDDNISPTLFWVEAVDEESGKSYFFNRKTRERTWAKPECLVRLEKEDLLDPNDPLQIKDNWLEGCHDSGRVFYYNRVTNATSWKRPDIFTFDEPINKIEKKDVRDGIADLGDPKKWTQATDRRTGRTCYVHSDTGATSWKKPKGFDELHEQTTNEPEKVEVVNKEEILIEISDAPENPNEREMIVLRKNSELRTKQMLRISDDEDDDSQDDEVVIEEVKEWEIPQRSQSLFRISVTEKIFDFTKTNQNWFGRGKKVDLDELLTFRKELIKAPLLRKNRHYTAEAIQMFKNIMSYMGDRPSSKNDIGHVRKLIRNTLSLPDTMKDEVFLQIAKQLSGHPILSNCIKGWELLMVVLASFPPSRSMVPSLEDFLNHHINDPHVDTEIKRIACICMDRIEMIRQRGARELPPSEEEILKDCSSTPFIIKVYTLDKSVRSIEINPFSSIQDLKKAMLTKTGLSFGEPFAIFEQNYKNEENFITDNKRVMDVYAGWKEDKLAEGPDPYRFMFKAKLILKTTNPRLLDDEDALHLFYVQAVHDIVHGRYPAEARDCPSLAALFLQANFGDFRSEEHSLEWISSHLPDLVPNNLLLDRNGKLHEKTVDAMAQKVLTKYTKLTSISTQEAIISYLDYVQNWPLYGATFFNVEQNFRDDEPVELRLAITSDAIILAHRDSSVCCFFKLF